MADSKRLLHPLQRLLAIEGLAREENALAVRAGFALAALAMLIRAFFWAYTQRYWEDALITCLHSENFVLGLGLSHYRPGEPPLHGFTSPLSVLVPLIGDCLHVGWGIDFLKLVSIPASALTVLYLLGIGIHPSFRLPTPLLVLVMGYAAIEHHQILWGMAGMETQFSVLFLIASIYYIIAWNPVRLGVSLGLCMLVRPDYGFWTLIVGAYALCREPCSLLRIVPIALAVYAPWLVFTTGYYGSPLPNPMIAKGIGFPKWWEKAGAVNFFTIKQQLRTTMSQLHLMLGPTFFGNGTGVYVFLTRGPHSSIANGMFVFTMAGVVALLFRRQYVLWPLAAFSAVYALYYAFCVPCVFGWYIAPYVLVLLLLGARGLQAVFGFIPGARSRTFVQWVAALGYLSLFIGVLPETIDAESRIQRDIENPVRKAAGLYLAGILKPGEAVGSESLGYMAYYSRGNVYDWPGLCSRKVVEWSKAHPGQRNLEEMLKGLQPEYLFLRDFEIRKVFRDPQWFRGHYHPIRVFAADPNAIKEYRLLRGNWDTSFRVYKKSRSGDLPQDDSLWPP